MVGGTKVTLEIVAFGDDSNRTDFERLTCTIIPPKTLRRKC